MGPDELEDWVVRACAREALSNSSHSSCMYLYYRCVQMHTCGAQRRTFGEGSTVGCYGPNQVIRLATQALLLSQSS